VSVKTAEFVRIANAGKVTVQLGKTHFDLTAAHMKPLRTLAKRAGA